MKTLYIVKKLCKLSKSKLNKALTHLYDKTWILAISWTMLTIILTLLYEYNTCVKCANAINWITNIGLLSLGIFFLTAGILTIFTIRQIFTIRNNVKNTKTEVGKLNDDQIDNLLTNVDIVEAMDFHPSNWVVASKVKILPWYMIGIYSLSRLYIVDEMIDRGKESVLFAIDVFWVWFFLFLVSWFIWLELIKYANKDKIYSVSYTIFVILITWLTLEWQTLIPYFIDISKIFQCATETYIIDKNLTIDNNVSKCLPLR